MMTRTSTSPDPPCGYCCLLFQVYPGGSVQICLLFTVLRNREGVGLDELPSSILINLRCSSDFVTYMRRGSMVHLTTMFRATWAVRGFESTIRVDEG